MQRIRIMHVLHSLGNGGMEQGVRKLLAGLDPSVFEQMVCTVASSPDMEPATGARVFSLKQPEHNSRFLINKFYEVFRCERPDIVHSRNWGTIEAVPAARLARLSAVIHSEHGLEAHSLRKHPLQRKVFRRLAFGFADQVFAVSEGLKTYYVKELRLRNECISVIRNGVDTERFRSNLELRQSYRCKFNLLENSIVVGTVGRLDPVKDHHTLFTTVETLISLGLDVRLVVVGDGPERESLATAVRNRNQLASRTIFTGHQSDIAGCLNSFDIFVLPSLAEGMSNALLEAMAVGIAPIATRIPGNIELIEDGISGFLFTPRDQCALADHLRSLCCSPELRFRLGQNARARMEQHFSLQCMLKNYAALYETALHRKRRTGLSRFERQAPAV